MRLFARATHSRWTPIAIIVIGVCAIYANALNTSFQFDDFNVIVNYSAVHSLRAWFDSLPAIRPLLKLSYVLNWTVDQNPFGFHLVNLICHFVSTLLIFFLARRLFRQSPSSDAMALFAALLFALHPAQTEAVTYISGRSVALMSMFYLSAVLAAISERAWPRNVLAPLLFIAALLVKETAWTLPFAVLLVCWLRDVRLGESLRCTRALWIALFAAGFAIAAIPAYQRMLLHVVSIRSVLENLALQTEGWWYLLTRPLLLRTNIDPDLPLVPVFDLAWWLKLSVLSICALGIWVMRSRWLHFALLWFFLHLLPTNSFLPRNDIANDRQLYLALIGPALAMAYGVSALRIPRLRLLRITLPLLLLTCCALTTWQRNRDYRDEISLWEATVRHSPNKARAWNNLGYAYEMAGRRDDARTAYERALALDSDYDRARINWRLLQEFKGRE